jgi:hypothetical protein
MSYVQNLYGNVPQQVDNALIPSKQNIFTGNLIQPLSGGRKSRGGNFAAAIPPLAILAMQQLYGRKSRNRSRRRGKRFKRSRKLR